MAKRSRAPEVHKFGGASLADAQAVRQALGIIVSRAAPAVIVVSALAGVTDALLALAALALTGKRGDPDGAIKALCQRHLDIVTAVIPTAEARREIKSAIGDAFGELKVLLDGVASLRELTLRTNDLIVARGERLSAMIIAASLSAMGKRAQYIDATELILTDGKHGGAFPDLPATDQLVRTRLNPLIARGVIPIVPGFIGGTTMGTVATLGRGGST